MHKQSVYSNILQQYYDKQCHNRETCQLITWFVNFFDIKVT